MSHGPPGEPAADAGAGHARAHWRFRLSSLMLLIGLIAVCLSAARHEPALGILLAIVLIPALVRALGLAARSQAAGQPMTRRQTLGAFWDSVVIVITIVVISGVAFGIAFLMMSVSTIVVLGGADPESLVVAVPCGIIAAALVAVRLVRQYREPMVDDE